MIGGPMKLAVNDWIVANPDRALEATGLVLAAGIGAVTLRQIMKVVGVKEKDLPEGGMEEAELLDQECPDGFWGGAVNSVHANLVGWRMRAFHAIGAPRVGWAHGNWTVRHLGPTWTSDPGFDQVAHLVDLTDIVTPAMDSRGKLI